MNPPPKKSASAPPPAPHDDPSIPVLTDRLGLPPLEFDTTLPLIDTADPDLTSEPGQEPADPLEIRDAPPTVLPAAAVHPQVNSAAVAQATPRQAAAAPRPAFDETHWPRVELELRASVLREVARQLPRDVEEIVRTRMSAAIERAIETLAAETRLAAAASLREIVERAVRAELDRLRKSTREPN